MINNIKNRIISFVGVFICAFCFIPKEVFAVRVEIPPTETYVSPHDENLIMMHFPDQVSQVILAHMSNWQVNQNNQRQTQVVGTIYTGIGIYQGSFRVETPQGASLTISSPGWFRIRVIQAQVRGQSNTFSMPVIEYKIEDVATPPTVVLEYPEVGLRYPEPRNIQPEI